MLWLDCDREGEAIAFEVIDVVAPVMSGSRVLGPSGGILRAKFSAVTKSDVMRAMENLVAPNRCEANAVAARQELDLKVGVAFSRFQTGYFRGKFSGLDSRVLSYGPCQTPTLGFIVVRHIDIQNFQPERFWSLDLEVLLSHQSAPSHAEAAAAGAGTGAGHHNTTLALNTSSTGAGLDAQANGEFQRVSLSWKRGRLFHPAVVRMFLLKVASASYMQVARVATRAQIRARPQPMNTVEMLKQASRFVYVGVCGCV